MTYSILYVYKAIYSSWSSTKPPWIYYLYCSQCYRIFVTHPSLAKLISEKKFEKFRIHPFLFILFAVKMQWKKKTFDWSRKKQKNIQSVIWRYFRLIAFSKKKHSSSRGGVSQQHLNEFAIFWVCLFSLFSAFCGSLIHKQKARFFFSFWLSFDCFIN